MAESHAPDRGDPHVPDRGAPAIPERVALPPRPPPARRFGASLPKPAVAALLVPGLALAAAAGLQRCWEGPDASGDAIGRWLVLSCALGVVAGLVAGLLLSRSRWSRALWTAWGAASPLLVCAALLGTVAAVRPLRDRAAAFAQSRCLAEGRSICAASDFRARCRLAARTGADEAKLLGPPVWQRCDREGCTRRYLYEGPWRPDDQVAPGVVLCSVVSDANGAPVRFAMVTASKD